MQSTTTGRQARVLVLGGYGFIGLTVVRGLCAAGHAVTAVGRSVRARAHLPPGVGWRAADIATLTQARDWRSLLADIDVVVNASGALQSSRRDRLQATQADAIVALVEACEAAPVERFVQISAPGARADASTEFMRTKAAADARVAASSLDWVILRPGLVIGANAYGGTALIRMLAALPWVQPLVAAERPLQTVCVDELADVVAQAVQGRLPPRRALDVVENAPHPLRDVVAAFRAWLGFAPARLAPDVPPWLARIVATGADLLGHLGWRSPLRSTALTVLADGVVGDPGPLQAARGQALSSLGQTLARLPSTLQERWFARLYLLLPIVVATLSAFWIASGVIGLVRIDKAATVAAQGTGLSASAARWLVIAGAGVDIALGAAVMVRPWARTACLGMFAVTLAYLGGASILRPDLWLDPLGPLVKTLPAAVLALVAWALLEER